MKKRWFLESRPFARGVYLYVAQESDQGLRHVQITLTVADQPLRDGFMVPESAFLTERDCQDLMNELWRLGIRPANGQGAGAHVEAINAHLQDMRRLVFEPNK